MKRPSFRRCASGSTAVEFAMVIFPFLLVLFGTIEFARLQWTREALQQTAIAGARCMGMTQTSCGTSGTYSATLTTAFIIAQAAKWNVPLAATNMTLTPVTTCGGVAGFSQVALRYTFSTVVAKLIGVLASTSLTATACFPNHP